MCFCINSTWLQQRAEAAKIPFSFVAELGAFAQGKSPEKYQKKSTKRTPTEAQAAQHVTVQLTGRKVENKERKKRVSAENPLVDRKQHLHKKIK